MENTLTNIEQYYKESGSQMDFEHFKLICQTPFIFVKKIISSGILKNIRLQYLGTFQVSPSRVTYSKKVLQENYDKGLISEKRYTERIKVLSNYEA